MKLDQSCLDRIIKYTRPKKIWYLRIIHRPHGDLSPDRFSCKSHYIDRDQAVQDTIIFLKKIKSSNLFFDDSDNEEIFNISSLIMHLKNWSGDDDFLFIANRWSDNKCYFLDVFERDMIRKKYDEDRSLSIAIRSIDLK